MKYLTAGLIVVLSFAAGCTPPSPTGPSSTASSPLITSPPPAPPPAPSPTPAPAPPPENPPAPTPRPTQYSASGSYRIAEYRQAPGALAMIVPSTGPVTVNLTIAPSGVVEGQLELLTTAYWRGNVRGRVREGSRVEIELTRNEGPAPEGLAIGLDLDTSTGRGELLFTLDGGSIACSVNLTTR